MQKRPIVGYDDGTPTRTLDSGDTLSATYIDADTVPDSYVAVDDSVTGNMEGMDIAIAGIPVNATTDITSSNLDTVFTPTKTYRITCASGTPITFTCTGTRKFLGTTFGNTDTELTIPSGAVAVLQVLSATWILIKNLSSFNGGGGGTSNKIENGTSNVSIIDANGAITMSVNNQNLGAIQENALALGKAAGLTSQGIYSVAIGTNAGQDTQSSRSVAIGTSAGNQAQGNASVAIGNLAAQYNQGTQSVAIGNYAGAGDNGSLAGQGDNSIAIGTRAGENNQGDNAIAIGAAAGIDDQHDNSIVINASGINLNSAASNSLTIAPIREVPSNTANALFYNTTTKEVTYSASYTDTMIYENANVAAGTVIPIYSFSTAQGNYDSCQLYLDIWQSANSNIGSSSITYAALTTSTGKVLMGSDGGLILTPATDTYLNIAQDTGTQTWRQLKQFGSEIWIVGGGGIPYVSTDDGVSFSARTTGTTAITWYGIEKTDTGVYVVAGGNANVYTSPTGASGSWTNITTGGSGIWFGLIKTAGNKLLVPAASGRIYSSDDNGTTWTAQIYGSADFRSIAQNADSSIIVAAGFSGTLYTSVDGGVSFAAGTSGITQIIATMYFSTLDNTFYGFGSTGPIIKSTDGFTWTSSTPFGTYAGNGVTRTNDGKWFIGSASGRIITSNADFSSYNNFGPAGTYHSSYDINTVLATDLASVPVPSTAWVLKNRITGSTIIASNTCTANTTTLTMNITTTTTPLVGLNVRVRKVPIVTAPAY